MGFLALLWVASMPIVQVLFISILGAFLASGYCNILTSDARKSLNKIVFFVFTPSLIFADLAKTVTMQDIISWWFMPVNIGLTFVFGGTLGWLLVKMLKPEPQLEGLIVAMSSAGNLGNLLLIIVPAICHENGSPFGERNVCSSMALSYASLSMALGGFFIWTHTYHLMRTSAMKYQALEAAEQLSKAPNGNFDATNEACLLNGEEDHIDIVVPPTKFIENAAEYQAIPPQESEKDNTIKRILHKIVDELLAPPTLGAIAGFIFGVIEGLRNLIIGEGAPLRVVQDTIQLLGDGTIPCITLILGGNLMQGLRSSKIKPLVTVGVICVRFLILPIIGIGVVKGANSLGFLPSDPLFHYVLMIQFTLPPAMNISTMAQLFDMGQAECSALLLWTYLVAAIALTGWSTIYMWILS